MNILADDVKFKLGQTVWYFYRANDYIDYILVSFDTNKQNWSIFEDGLLMKWETPHPALNPAWAFSELYSNRNAAICAIREQLERDRLAYNQASKRISDRWLNA